MSNLKKAKLDIVTEPVTTRASSSNSEKSEDHYRILVEEATDIICTIDIRTGRISSVNRYCKTAVGYEREEILGMESFLEIVHPDDHETVIRRLREYATERQRHPNFPFRLKKADGNYLDVELNGSLIRDSDGNPHLYLGFIRDITERKRTEEALKESEQRYRTLVDNALTGICVVQDGKIQFANRRLADISGYLEEDLQGKQVLELVHPDDHKSFGETYARRLAGEIMLDVFQYRTLTRDGDTKWVEVFGTLIEYHGQPAIMASVIDITRRKRAEEALRESEEKYRLLVENAEEAIYILQDGFIKFPNRKTMELMGYTEQELDTIPSNQLVHPEDRDLVWERYTMRMEGKDTPAIYSFRVLSKDKETVWVQLNAVTIMWEGRPATLNFLRDITLEKRLETQLQQAQKMESIGTLAGGIAHDFNNLLGGILGYASFMKSQMEKDHPFYKYVETIEKTSERAAELTSQLLGFARGGKYHVRPVNVNRIIEETLTIIERTIDKSIQIETRLADQLPTIEADAGQLQQVLVNLCVNASDAMPAGGDLIIETGIGSIAEENAEAHMGAKPGSHVLLSVTDTGIGMNRETRERIFEPFFTTKAQGKGTGLGLSMVYGVIKNHGGYIHVHSEPAHGTTFKICLPVGGRPEKEHVSQIEAPHGNNELILVADDEEHMCSLAKEILETHNYRVLVAGDGAEAIEIYRKYDGAIGLVILDLVMPKMGGHETFMRMRAHDPAVRALLSTGYSQDGKAKESLDNGVMGFLQKPYQPHTLLSKVRSVLDGK